MVTDETLEIAPIAGVDEVRREWTDLAWKSENPFATPEWCEAWLEHIADGFRLRLFACCGDDGSLVALLPLVVTQGRYVRKLRFLGFGAANQLGPIAAPENRDLAAEALRAALAATRSDWDLFLGESLPGEGWSARLGSTQVGRLGSPVVRGGWQSWDQYLASRSSNLRQELRRKERRLQEHGLRYRLVASREELEPAMDILFGLHRARWQEDASRWFGGQEAFHRAFARAALERGWLRLRLLELEGGAVAGYLGFSFGDTEWFYQLGREPSAESSVGLVLVAHALREAIAEGVTDFRLGPGAQSYKLRFATDDPGLETVGSARGLRGRAALFAARRRGS
jgi:CelD/BcsL family acetyltransferase involved in cellulose biosynthesis